jgi:hypothetical protein
VLSLLLSLALLAMIAPVGRGLWLFATGLTRVRPRPRASAAPPLELFSDVVATALVLGVMLGAVVLAWPRPLLVLAVSALNCLALSYVAFRQQAPAFHWPALACLAAGYLTGFHLLRGNDLAEALLSAQSGSAAVGPFLAAEVAAELLYRLRLQAHARTYAFAGGLAALVSMLLVAVPPRGAEDPATALKVFGACAAGTLAANARWRSPMVSSLGLALAAAATLWGLHRLLPQQVAVWGIVLAGEALTLGVLAALIDKLRRPWLQETYGEPLARTAEGLAPVALLAAAWPGLQFLTWMPEQAGAAAVITALFLLLALVERRPFLARLAGWMLLATVVIGAGCWAGTAPAVGVAVAATGMFLAVVSVRVLRPAAEKKRRRIFYVWRETAAATLPLALACLIPSLSANSLPRPAVVGVILTTTGVLLAWCWDRRLFTWIASTLALAALALVTGWPTVALLGHASLALLVSRPLMSRSVPSADGESIRQKLNRLFAQPLAAAALLSSLLTAPALLATGSPTGFPTSLYLFWLAALWTVIARWELRSRLFAASQAALGLAMVAAVLAWMTGQGWLVGAAAGGLNPYLQPRCLHLCGLGLALLCCGCTSVRIAGRTMPRVHTLLSPGWPGLDRWMLPLVLAAQVALLGVAGGRLLFLPPEAAAWVAEVGAPLGWLAVLVALLAGFLYLVRQGTRVMSAAALGTGLALLILFACTVSRWSAEVGYRLLLLGSPASALVAVLIARRAAVSQAWAASITGLVGVVGTAVALVGLKDLLVPQAGLWVAAAAGLFVAIGLLLAAWRRREGWVFAAGAALNLAASLVVRHVLVESGYAVADQWVLLAQVNASASALVGFFWLGQRRAFIPSDAPALSASKVLAVQIGLPLLGNAALWAVPVALFFAQPGQRLPAAASLIGQAAGWFALVLSAAAAGIYTQRSARQASAHVLGLAGIGVGVLSTCLAGSATDPAQLVLAAAWTCAALAITAYGEIGAVRQWEWGLASPALIQRWAIAFVLLAEAFALRGGMVASTAVGPVGLALVLWLLSVALAVRAQEASFFFTAGVLGNLAGGACWAAWLPRTLESLLFVQAFCFALSALAWSLLLRVIPAGERPEPPPRWRTLAAAFAQTAATLGLLLLAGLTATITAQTWRGVQGPAAPPALAWSAWLVVAAARVCQRDRNFPAAGYALGLIGLGLACDAMQITAHQLPVAAPVAAAVYYLLMAAVARCAGGSSPGWFPRAQAGLALAAVCLSFWPLLAPDSTWTERLAGPLTLLILLPGLVVRRRLRSGLQTSERRVAKPASRTQKRKRRGKRGPVRPESPTRRFYGKAS